MKTHERMALQTLYKVIAGAPGPPSGSTTVKGLTGVSRYVEAVRGPSQVLIDALMYGDKDEIQDRTQDLRDAFDHMDGL